MNASAPGWQPDPSGRHEYRYWDGSRWTDDVSDAGTTAVDPLAGPATPEGPPAPGDPTAVVDPTRGYAPTAYGTPTPPGGGPGSFPPADAGTGPGGYGPGGYPAYGGSGQVPPAKPPRSGPSTGLLVGLGLLAVALIVVIVVVLAGGDDGDGGETTASETPDTSETSEADTPDTTTATDGSGGGTDTSIDLGAGDIDFNDPEVREAFVDLVAGQLESSGFTREQAECFTGAMLDGLGAERLAEIGQAGGDMSSLTPEDMSSIIDAVSNCGLTDLPTAGTG